MRGDRIGTSNRCEDRSLRGSSAARVAQIDARGRRLACRTGCREPYRDCRWPWDRHCKARMFCIGAHGRAFMRNRGLFCVGRCTHDGLLHGDPNSLAAWPHVAPCRAMNRATLLRRLSCVVPLCLFDLDSGAPSLHEQVRSSWSHAVSAERGRIIIS